MRAAAETLGDVQPGTAPDSAPRRAPLWHRLLAGLLKTLLPVVIVAGAGYAAQKIYLSAPVAERGERPRIARLVDTAPAVSAASGPVIEAWGTVAPARSLALSTEITGRVEHLHPELTAGGVVSGGDELMRLDDQTQRLALAEAEADMREIEAQILMEEGQQDRAQRDLKRLTKNLTDRQKALIGREPQMAELKARHAAAEAARDRAHLEILRMRIFAPFDAMVMSEQVASGSMLAAGEQAAMLVASDRFHVTLAVPPAALDWIDPTSGQEVRLTQPGVWPEGTFRTGRVVRLGAGLSDTGRMAELIVEVADPLSRKPENAGKPPLLLGSYLRAEIAGRAVEGAVEIDRAWLHDAGTVWVMTPENVLEIRTVEIAWRGADKVLVSSGLAPGDRVVTTQLATVADGMDLRLRESGAQ